MHIRKAQEKDLPALLEIYNYEVVNGCATLDLNPRTMEEWQAWYKAHNVDNHPLYVCIVDGKAAGYASLSQYRLKEAYRSTVELSIYVAPNHRREGLAAAMMEFLINEAKADPSIHCVVSVITSGNEASRALHEKFGFEFCGTIREVGRKFGRYIGSDNYCLIVE